MSLSDNRQPPAPIYGTSTTYAAAPAAAPVAVQQAAYAQAAPVYAVPPKRGNLTLTLAIIGFSVVGVIGLLVAAYLIFALGPLSVVIAGILALIPLAIVLFGVWWIDRWDREPIAALAFGLLWGAAVAVFVALVAGLGVEVIVALSGGIFATNDFIGAVIQAPIVEEGGKGLGILLIFLVARKHFDSPVDGVVYAAVVAGGFAFTENILYFGSQLLAGGGIVQVFIMRGLMSPFAHVMFTACTGIALGFAARRFGTFGAIGVFFLGLIPAILLHALWNGALFFVTDFFVYYGLVQFPLFVGAVVLVVFLRRKEAALTRDRLAEYASVGWFSPAEVPSLATGRGRRAARSWANQRGIGSVMKKYTKDATRLAFTRQRLISGRAVQGAQEEETALLAAIVAGRAQLQAPPAQHQPQYAPPVPR